SHLFTHTRNNPYQYYCIYCNMYFLKEDNLRDHMSIQISSLKSHPKRHTRTKSYQQIHDRVTNLGTETVEYPYKCGYCNKVFSDIFYFEWHAISHSKETREYECHHCNKIFSNNWTLTIHLSTHPEKPFKCTVCDSAFLHNSGLTSHMMTHTEDKSYKSSQCNKLFLWKNSMLQHQRTHIGRVKPYHCSQFDQASVLKPRLARHHKTHTGYEPHQYSQIDSDSLSEQTVQVKEEQMDNEQIGTAILSKPNFDVKEEENNINYSESDNLRKTKFEF
ncbi:unnamed protein product, partial [Meganyctiphanes norvegica]